MKADIGELAIHPSAYPERRWIYVKAPGIGSVGRVETLEVKARLTPAQMRRLAAMLVRAADRIDRRRKTK